MPPVSVSEHLNRAFSTDCRVDGDESTVKWWPFGVVSNEALSLECLAQR
jgi:hypothetical protein